MERNDETKSSLEPMPFASASCRLIPSGDFDPRATYPRLLESCAAARRAHFAQRAWSAAATFGAGEAHAGKVRITRPVATTNSWHIDFLPGAGSANQMMDPMSRSRVKMLIPALPA